MRRDQREYMRTYGRILCANCNWIKRAERNETRKVNRLSDAPPREHTGSLFERDR